MPVVRTQIYVKPDGDNLEVLVGKKQTVTYTVLDGDRTRRVLTNDTLTAEAKSIDIATPESLSLTWTADADQTAAGNRGKAHLVFPAAQLTTARIGTITVNLILDDGSGAEVVGVKEIELVANDAV